MGSWDKRENRNLRIYIFLSVVIIAIGAIMWVYDQTATGRLEGRRGHGGEVAFSGFQVVALGLLMLLVPLFFYYEEWKEKRKQRRKDAGE